VPHAAAYLAAHLAALAAGVALARAARGADDRSVAALAADWLPLALVPLFYAELPAVMAGVAGGGSAPVAYHDAAVIAWDARLFGTLSRDLARRLPSRALSELLHACYLSYYAIIYAPPALLWLRARRDAREREGARRAFAETALGVTLAFVACFATFALYPVQGPWYEWPAPDAVPGGPVRDLVQRILHAGSSRGTAFPSSHVAVATAQALLALRHQRAVGVVVALLAAGLAAGAVYGGLHYAIDAAVGALVGVAAAWTAVLALRRLARA
jgi:membrane-associated phospholipid phosphatase